MKQRLLLGLTSLMMFALAVTSNPLGVVRAACGDPNTANPDNAINSGIECGTSPIDASTGVTRTVNLLLFLVGVISVIVVIVGGLRYVLSGGDPKNTAAAKDTILYAVIGLVVALLAYAIVNFVLTAFL